MSCPATGIKDFPIQNNVTITQTLNESIFEPSTLDVQWAKRGTVPAFQENYLTEGIYSSGEQTTTLRLKGNSYTLKIVKLADPQHRTLLPDADKPLCLGEIVMIFESATALTEKFVFLCIPILNKVSSTLSPYLESIRLDRLPGRPISLSDLLPNSKKYVSYATCLHQVTSGKTNPAQAAVLVFTGGLLYPQAQFNDVVKKMKVELQLGSLFDGLMPKTNASPFLIATQTDYKNYLRYSELLASTGTSIGGQRIDSTDSYKCVPLNPDETVKNNRLIIDTDKGIPLSQVLKEKKDEQGEAKITPGMVERMIAVVLGTAAGIFILSIVAYFFSLVTSENADPAWPWLLERTRDLIPMIFVSMVVGIIGFLIGFFTNTT
jgi:hypothetical protein